MRIVKTTRLPAFRLLYLPEASRKGVFGKTKQPLPLARSPFVAWWLLSAKLGRVNNAPRDRIFSRFTLPSRDN
jgi:hypothetical protein